MSKDGKNILFLQTAHKQDDDRVFFHQYLTLTEHGFNCHIVSTLGEQFTLWEFRQYVQSAILSFAPQLIVCDTPKAVLFGKRAAGRGVKIVYDVTEWYPSKKNLRQTSMFLRPFKAVLLSILSIFAAFAADSFIFGEYHKARPFRIFFPWKKHILLPYYPSLQYIKPQQVNKIDQDLRLFYAGPLTEEKGFKNIIRVATKCAEAMPDTKICLTLVSNDDFTPDEMPGNLQIHAKKYLQFADFCEEITRHDIFLDLRKADFENTHCLPIKLFYYMAAGRPVIFSDLKAIRKGVPEIEDSLFSETDDEGIVSAMERYVADPALYKQISERNRLLFTQKYNWESIAEGFVSFLAN